MQAAFIDIGHDINAFLPFSEMGNEENLNQFSFSDDVENDNKIKNIFVSLFSHVCCLSSPMRLPKSIKCHLGTNVNFLNINITTMLIGWKRAF